MKIIFFPGWPRMESLLEPFIMSLRKDFSVEIYNKNTKRGEGKLILISYSAGAIPLLRFANKEDEVVMIAPAGLVNRGFFSHCFSFIREVFNTSRKIALKIIFQSMKTFLKNPFRAWREIKEIRRYLLEVKKDHFIITGKDDLFMPIDDFFTGKIIKVPGNHFHILEYPEKFAKKIKAIL